MNKITKYFIYLTILLIAVYDVYTIASHGTQTSISQVMITWSYEYPVFTFLMGFTMGHLFWRLSTDKRQ